LPGVLGDTEIAARIEVIGRLAGNTLFLRQLPQNDLHQPEFLGVGEGRDRGEQFVDAHGVDSVGVWGKSCCISPILWVFGEEGIGEAIQMSESDGRYIIPYLVFGIVPIIKGTGLGKHKIAPFQRFFALL